MAIESVGLLSPGDMGHTVGAVLHNHGVRMLTCLQGRSERTRALAAEAGFTDTATFEDLVRESDVILSILVPARAYEVAQRVAQAIQTTGADVLYADCNAISPRTARAVGEVILAAGGRFADASVIGPPPKKPGTKIYASGPGAAELAGLSAFGLDVRVLDGGIGQASGLKMCYGGLSKGLQALGTEVLVAARLMGLEEALKAEMQDTQSNLLAVLTRGLPRMTPKAYRWVGEMEEIATCFGDLGLTPKIHQGAAELFQYVAETPPGKESPENRDPNRDVYGVVAALANDLTAKVPS